MVAIDYYTVGAADRFGNFFVLRIPSDVDDLVDESVGIRALWDMGQRAKVVNEAHYYVGEAITSLSKGRLVVGGPEVILASTINGALLAFVPFQHKQEYDFYQQLEAHMRREDVNLCQRDHMAYRSYFQPVRNVIDGDLCERYLMLPYSKQRDLADNLDKTCLEISKKLEEVRNIL
jgi:splicing factor 3B subunit 3